MAESTLKSMISKASTHSFRNVVELRDLETDMRKKSSSDSLLMNREGREVNPRYRYLMTISGETFSASSSRHHQITESSPPCCAVGEHILTSNNRDFLTRSLSINSIVDVDINDISGDEEMLATTYSLRRCKNAVLKPYTWLLLLIGWRAYGKERVVRYPLFWQIINILYPIFVIAIFLYTNIMQAVTCHGKLNPKTDTVPATLAPLTMPPSYMNFNYKILPKLNQTLTPECSHIITTYIIPSVLHFMAFLYGFHYFRLQENEQLYSLMERVFVQAQTAVGMQDILIRNSRVFLVAAIFWLIANIGLEILYSFAFESLSSSFIQHLNIESKSLRYGLVILRFLGLIITQGVNIAVVVNYCTQCEMLVMHIRGICLHLHEKTLDIKNAMHEILGIKEFISLLNGTLGKMTALCIIGFIELILIGFGLLLCNQVHKTTVWSYRILFVVIWIIATLFPIIQAARVSKVGRKLTQISLEMRVFGYQAALQADLDSFILFIDTAKLRAKLFGVAIEPGCVVITIILLFFVILLLIIMDIVPISTIWRFL